jgi:hypothetical protein
MRTNNVLRFAYGKTGSLNLLRLCEVEIVAGVFSGPIGGGGGGPPRLLS